MAALACCGYGRTGHWTTRSPKAVKAARFVHNRERIATTQLAAGIGISAHWRTGGVRPGTGREPFFQKESIIEKN